MVALGSYPGSEYYQLCGFLSFRSLIYKMGMIRCQSPGWYHDDPDILAISLRMSHKPLILHLPPSLLSLGLSYCLCECLHHSSSCAFQKRGSPCDSSPTPTPSQPARVLSVSPIQTPLCTSIPDQAHHCLLGCHPLLLCLSTLLPICWQPVN